VLDSTGLELFGQGEWDAAKHGRTRRRWMKLHVAVDADTDEIAAHMLTDGHADDAAQVPDLLRQPEGSIASVIADGAYDGEPVYQAAPARQPDQPPDVIIPPRASAVPSTATQTSRDRAIAYPAYGRVRPHRMAARDWLRQAQPGRNRHRQVQTSDRAQAPRPHR